MIAACVALWPAQAIAHSPSCTERAEAIGYLQNEHKEALAWEGISIRMRTSFELWVSEKGGWTLISHHANGQTCLIGGGTKSRFLEPIYGDPV